MIYGRFVWRTLYYLNGRLTEHKNFINFWPPTPPSADRAAAERPEGKTGAQVPFSDIEQALFEHDETNTD